VINIDEGNHGLYKRLTEGTDPISSPFRTMKDVFMWAAVLGYRRGERRPLSGRRIIVFRWAQLAPQTDVPLLKALAIASEDGTEVLRDQSVILSIAEEYANAGIRDLETGIVADNGQPLWNLTEIARLS
jgi:dnd system-associated protein 4